MRTCFLYAVPIEPPQNVAATSISSTEINVTWDEVPKEDRNGNITLYEVQYTQSAPGSIAARTNTSAREEMLQDLKPFTNYSIAVRAYTIRGPGPFSPDVVAMTDEDCKYSHKLHSDRSDSAGS